MNTNDCAVILAAGEGKRMKSKKPKAMCEVLFKPMLDWVTDAVQGAGVEDICVVTGHLREQIEEHIGGRFETVVQDANGYGTGYAVMKAERVIKAHSGGNVLILCGDAPFIDSDTISGALQYHNDNGCAVTVITACLDCPDGYGRIVRADDGSLVSIVEQNDATEEQKAIREVNSGAYWFSADALSEVLFSIENNNPKGEYYLTDTIELLVKRGDKAGAFTASSTDVILGANSRAQLAQMNELIRRRVIDKLLDAGVDIPCDSGVIIDPTAQIGADTQILPNTIIKAGVKIGENCQIGPNTLIEDSVVGDNVKLNNVQCCQSVIDDGVKCGPFVHILPNSHLHKGV